MGTIIERKHTYWGNIVDHSCKLLQQKNDGVVLYHKIKQPFEIATNKAVFTVPKNAYTTAYYWSDRCYNVYVWRNQNGRYIGSYVNIVSNTTFTTNTVEFSDLIIDLFILPDLSYYILDRDELPCPLTQFENGSVMIELYAFIESLDLFMPKLLKQVNKDFPHSTMKEWLSK